MATYHAAVRAKGNKWKIVAHIEMPEQSCLATADTMAKVAGYTNATVLLPHQLNQKNVLPPDADVPTVQYDARKYWEDRLAQHGLTKDLIRERALEEGVTL